jgi:hypothetical protein
MGIEKKIPNSSNEFFHKIFMFLQKIANSVEDARFLVLESMDVYLCVTRRSGVSLLTLCALFTALSMTPQQLGRRCKGSSGSVARRRGSDAVEIQRGRW